MNSVLTSWKDIASYVGKGTRTVQRWEREVGFPVRRTKFGSKSPVLAITTEIDAWVRLQRFAHGRVGLVDSERTALRRSLKALQSENRDLRDQLTLAQAKLFAIEERQTERLSKKTR
jgi:hypothetical protein